MRASLSVTTVGIIACSLLFAAGALWHFGLASIPAYMLCLIALAAAVLLLVAKRSITVLGAARTLTIYTATGLMIFGVTAIALSIDTTQKTAALPPVSVTESCDLLDAESEEIDQARYNEQVINDGINDLDSAISANPDDFEKYIERAWAYNHLGLYGKAREDLNRAIRLNPGSAEAYAKRAWINISCGDNRRAVKDATRAIKIDPKNQDAYEARVVAYYSLGEVDKAVQDAKICQAGQ
ncbi:MAG: tetratricopeptide repeat protein [Cyanobacteria bacterium HKST-UBA02]|nr:tetratricopeptide repeat protein [Cyanobacteria bacterium HKST-UBA02]